VWALSYLGANFALVLVVVLAVVALGAVAWFAKNWKVAVAAVAVLAAGLAYQQVDKTAYQRRVSEEAAAKVAVLQGRLDTLRDVNQADAERALAANARIAELEARAAQTPANDTACLPEDAAKRVGDIH
jgi:apolipoprotein N-acyltransferase